MFESVDTYTDTQTHGRLDGYTISLPCEPLAQVSEPLAQVSRKSDFSWRGSLSKIFNPY